MWSLLGHALALYNFDLTLKFSILPLLSGLWSLSKPFWTMLLLCCPPLGLLLLQLLVSSATAKWGLLGCKNYLLPIFVALPWFGCSVQWQSCSSYYCESDYPFRLSWPVLSTGCKLKDREGTLQLQGLYFLPIRWGVFLCFSWLKELKPVLRHRSGRLSIQLAATITWRIPKVTITRWELFLKMSSA